MTILKRFREEWADSPVKRTIVLSILIITVITYFQKYITIGINATDSLPQRLFVIRKGKKEMIRGNYYAFRFTKDSNYYPLGAKLVKGLIGLPGDEIQTDLRRKIIIFKGENEQRSFKLMDRDSEGKKITERFVFNGKIPEHKYFFATEEIGRASCRERV